MTVRTKNGNKYGFEIDIQGPSTVIYRPDKPLPCGARVWIETDATVVLDKDEVIE